VCCSALHCEVHAMRLAAQLVTYSFAKAILLIAAMALPLPTALFYLCSYTRFPSHYAGFNVETVEYKNISFTVWDVGGQDKVRHSSQEKINPSFYFSKPCIFITIANHSFPNIFLSDPSPLETLLPEHSRPYLRRG